MTPERIEELCQLLRDRLTNTDKYELEIHTGKTAQFDSLNRYRGFKQTEDFVVTVRIPPKGKS